MNLGAFGEAPKVVTHYMALFDNIIHHMRFPKFIAIVKDELGGEVSTNFMFSYFIYFCV